MREIHMTEQDNDDAGDLRFWELAALAAICVVLFVVGYVRERRVEL